MVEASERVIEAFGFATHAILSETAHDCPAYDLSISKLLEQPSLLQHVQQGVLYKIYNQ